MDINHPAEIKIHRYLSDVRNGKRGMSDATIARIVADVKTSLEKQFEKRSKNKFSLRMSSIGRPYCQLWFEKNDPEGAIEPSANFLMNMLIGDIVEAVFKGILSESSVTFSDGFKSVLKVTGEEIPGTHDLIMDNKVDDIKSASPWSYTNKFKDFNTLAESDPFGYVGQLVGYSKALGVDIGGWWVINKATGEFKYVSAAEADTEAELTKIKDKTLQLRDNQFKRCFDSVPETYRKKETGNEVLSSECSWCKYRYKCWPDLVERSSLVSQAKDPPTVGYVKIAHKYLQDD